MAVCILSAAFFALTSRAATYLGPSTQTQTPDGKVDSYTPSYPEEAEEATDKTDAEADDHIPAYLRFLEPEDVPENWLPARFRASAEIGLQFWYPSSSSGQYEASYDIDPVTATIFETSVRMKSWLFLVDYTTSFSEPDRVRNLLAQVSRIDPGKGAWWSLYAESGAVEGEAGTVDQFGTPVEYPVDTVWHRIGIDWRTYGGYAVGLVYEDLTMPNILTFNNEEVAFAIFDEDVRSRTLSLSLGYDRARKLMDAFNEGGAWAWTLEGSLGFGWLSYSEGEARGIVEQQGYDFESNNLLLAGALDGRLGYTYSKEIWGNEIQCFAGVRLRTSGWVNLRSDESESDTVELDAALGLIIPGAFARVSFQW
ncbi:hypothetical protein P4E94_07900 [Pontiellaceae bacterium B12219]|nr:hypothetical protein [Pontiellaceae bacterium B12219]